MKAEDLRRASMRRYRMRTALALAAALSVAVPAFAGNAADPQEDSELAPGIELLSQRRWEEAEDWFYRYLKDHRSNAEGWRKLAFAELHRPGGDEVKARKYLDTAVELEPDNPIGLMLLGRTLQVSGQRGAARDTYDKLINMGEARRQPTRNNAVHLARFNRALIAIEEDDTQLATELLGEVLRREPQNAFAAYELGIIAKDARRHEEAEELLRKAEENLSRWAPLEIWAYPQGRYSYARDDVRFDLALTLIAVGRHAEARPLLEPLVDLARSRDRASQNGSSSAERSLLEGSIVTRFANAPFAYAVVLEELGEKKAAAKMFKEFSRMRIGDDALKREAKERAKRKR